MRWVKGMILAALGLSAAILSDTSRAQNVVALGDNVAVHIVGDRVELTIGDLNDLKVNITGAKSVLQEPIDGGSRISLDGSHVIDVSRDSITVDGVAETLIGNVVDLTLRDGKVAVAQHSD